MKVYVIMANDFPNGVFKSEEKAEGYCAGANKGDKKAQERYGGARIYYRVYPFDLQE